MNSKNVILSLILVVIMLAFSFMKIRFWEPKRTLSFNRNPSRIEYSKLALCRMGCRFITANDITAIIKTGEINLDECNLKSKPFPTFALEGITRKGENVRVLIIQYGKTAKVETCLYLNLDGDCHCLGEPYRTFSFFKKNI